MHILTALVSSLPVLALLAVPALADHPSDHVTVLKRDAPLSARDLELAAMNAVDVERMFKHSVVKRSDEEWTIWVHNSFQDVNNTDHALHPRQLRARPIIPFFRTHSDLWCGWSSYDDHTTSGSPTTGGTQEMERWAQNNRGFFDLDDAFMQSNGNVDLIVAGSNGGTNAVFIAKKHPLDWGRYAYVGTWDIKVVVREAMHRYQRQIDGRWKVGAHGGFRCGPTLVPWDIGAKVDWWIAWTSQRA